MYLSDVLYDMGFSLEKCDDNKFKIYDMQTHIYMEKDILYPDEKYSNEELEENIKYSSLKDIIERLEIYINDYWFKELIDELSEIGELEDESWKGLYESTLKHKHRFEHQEYLTYLDVIKCLVNPELFEGIQAA